ncbi:MAG: hypothetical protein LLF94_05360 [Chlamydiales bacterium]|nr:hypothetical protein [Chlamydiales bacterium]
MSVSTTHVHSHACQHHTPSTYDTAITGFEKVSAVALGVFSAYVNAKRFIPFFALGLAIGVYSALQDPNGVPQNISSSSCAHGLIEQLTQVKLPRMVALIANIAVTICHIDHHDTVFVPITAISLGNWAGKIATCKLINEFACLLVP